MYKLTVEIEKSDHEGYCSGAECEYASEIVSKTFSSSELGSVGDMFETLKRNIASNGETFLELYTSDDTKLDVNLEKFFKEYTELNDGSGYCELDKNCVEKELDRHDYRINLISVEVI
jgi:septation ring formation regulator EzrA